MKLTLPTGLTQFVGRNTLIAQKHSPTILFAAGITGFVATTVLASRATLKLHDVLDQFENDKAMAERALDNDDVDYDEFDYKSDVATLYGTAAVDIFKLYGPAILVGGLSVAALTSSHHILNKRNAGLTAAYAALDRAFTQYRNRVRDEYGDEKERELRHGVIKHEYTITDENGKTVKQQTKKIGPDGPSMYACFFDELNKNWSPVPAYNKIFLLAQQRYANDLLKARGHVFLNDVYDGLGIDRTPAGAVVGWVISKDGDNDVDFGIFNGEKEGSIDFVNGRESAILLDFNVDGVIWDKI